MTNKERCASCGAGPLRLFYEARGIPVHSTLLMDSADEARDYPTRDLVLGFCRACGFIQNTVFDPSVHEYSTKCEESQGFSATFNAFLKRVTVDLIEKYGLRDKTVLEIGCGKGDFLELICELGNNKGIGIDPGVIPERKAGGVADRLTFIQDLYSPKYAHLTGDMVACRHTLEHIHDTYDFMSLVRQGIEARKDAVVFLEVPDVARVLKEVAFWDIYYEHCSYFTLGSLARLFRKCGFEILNLATDFADQYLLIEAKLPQDGRAPSSKLLPGEDDLAELTRLVDEFETRSARVLSGWRERIGGYKAEGKRTVVWGSSSKGVSFLTTLGLRDEIACVVDINPYRQKKFMPGTGHEIVGPERMTEVRPDVVLVMNPIYCDEIGSQLAAMGLHPELVPA